LLKMEEGTMCQEEQMGKDKEMDSLWSLHKET
jgi:hypothetical protein